MTHKVAIVTDSASDLTPAVRLRHGITVVPLNLHFGDETYRDGIDITIDEFMGKMATSDKLPATSQPATGAFEQVFRELAATHDEICCVLVSGRLSTTVQSATIASQSVASAIGVDVIDSGTVSSALGFQAIRAAELARSGATATEIAATLATEQGSYHAVFFVETLEHLRRGGRIGRAAQLLGAAIKLRPLLRIEGGQVVPFERTRTRRRAISGLLDFARDLSGIERAAVMYNTTPDDAADLARRLAAQTGCDVETVKLGPVLSTHVGPGVLGIVLKESLRD